MAGQPIYVVRNVRLDECCMFFNAKEDAEKAIEALNDASPPTMPPWTFSAVYPGLFFDITLGDMFTSQHSNLLPDFVEFQRRWIRKLIEVKANEARQLKEDGAPKEDLLPIVDELNTLKGLLLDYVG